MEIKGNRSRVSGACCLPLDLGMEVTLEVSSSLITAGTVNRRPPTCVSESLLGREKGRDRKKACCG